MTIERHIAATPGDRSVTDQPEEAPDAPEGGATPPGGLPPQDEPPQDEPPPADTIDIGPPLGREVADALGLLDYATRTGFKAASGATVGDDVRKPILALVARLRLGCRAPAPDTCIAVPRVEWLAFVDAYARLAVLLHPVTAATLEATTERPRRWGTLLGRSDALRFTRWLWLWTILFAVAVIFTQWLKVIYGPPVAFDANINAVAPEFWNRARLLVTTLAPFAYGGLGACVYLLRSAHSFIAERSFDARRKPEYYNRILLGIISGGTILLFTKHLTNDGGQVIEVSSAALGFLAGYSTEFLFQAIERVIAAILPRVGLDSVQRARGTRSSIDVPVGNLTLEDLVDRFSKATNEQDKVLYRGLIDKLAERM